MPCCGGKKAGKPITRVQYVAGRIVFGQLRLGLSAGLHAAGVASPRVRRIATFWDQLSADWAEGIKAREGIVIGDPDAEVCAVEEAPPSHVGLGADDDFGADWGEDAFVDEPVDEPDAA